MRLAISHEIRTLFAAPTRYVVQTARLFPRGHDGQHLCHWRIDMDNDGRLMSDEDAFGNRTQTLSLDGPVDAITMTVSGEVETSDTQGIVRGAVERFPEALFLRATPLTTADAALLAFAREHREEDALATAHALMGAVHRSVQPSAPDGYADASEDNRPAPDSTPETVFDRTPRPAEAVLKAGEGDDRDRAHVMLAAARTLGIPARMIAGYRATDPANVGQSPTAQTQSWGSAGDDAMQRQGTLFEPLDSKRGAHTAWVEAHVPGLGWVAFDPTLSLCPDGRHVRVNVGLDGLGTGLIRAAGDRSAPRSITSTLSVADALSRAFR